MENIKYLNSNQIQQLTDLCEFYINRDIKKTFKRLESKYNIEFTTNKKLNLNLLWKAYSVELEKDTHKDIRYNKTFMEAYKQTNGFNIEASDILRSYIKVVHIEDFSTVEQFNIDDLINRLNGIIRTADMFYYRDSLSELLNVSDYYNYFNGMYGEGSVSSKALKSTKKLVQFFNDLLEPFPNKSQAFTAISEYYQSEDLNALHNTLFTKFD
ncbi:MAG: hypothetical protein ACOYMA_20350 [Bacteroidia bacterium]